MPRKTVRPPCTCWEHKDSAPTEKNGHKFNLVGSDWSSGWYWYCSCSKSARGHLQYQSPAVSYHQWEKHVIRAFNNA